ncbi:hypothetical protein MMC07_002258 [Pseudocyphellaria aurata]|nr:hypothetical protein [Pseudocyphellaria aurata]
MYVSSVRVLLETDQRHDQLHDEYADAQMEVDGTSGCLKAFTAQKQKHVGLKILLSIGGGGEGSKDFAAAAATADSRSNFAKSAEELVKSFKLDVDWEHPGDSKQGHDFLSLLRTIRKSLPGGNEAENEARTNYVVTAAFPAGEWALKHVPLSEVCEYLDFINLMAYDFYGSWTKMSGHHSQLQSPNYPRDRETTPSARSAITYLLEKKFPANKILLGIPVYGRSFLGTTDAGQLHSGHAGEEGTFEYSELPRPGAEEHLEEHLGAAYCVSDDGGFVSYDTAETVQIKANPVKKQGLARLFYWTATADVSGAKSLIQNGYNALHQ